MLCGAHEEVRGQLAEGSQFSPFSMQAPGMELRTSGLVAGIYPLSYVTDPVYFLSVSFKTQSCSPD